MVNMFFHARFLGCAQSDAEYRFVQVVPFRERDEAQQQRTSYVRQKRKWVARSLRVGAPQNSDQRAHFLRQSTAFPTYPHSFFFEIFVKDAGLYALSFSLQPP